MIIKTKSITESEVDVQIPFFLRNKEETHMIAVLDEKTFIRVVKLGDYTSITNSDLPLYASDIAEAWNKWHSMTETEFFDRFQDALESVSLQPKLAV